MSNNNTTQRKFQLILTDVPSAENCLFRFAGMRLVCDECSAPLHLYGEHFIDSYTNGYANTLRCLCDVHNEEFELSEVAK